MKKTKSHAFNAAPGQLQVPGNPAVWIEVIRRLVELGWLIWGGKAPGINNRGIIPSHAKRALRRYQRWAGLTPDAVPGPVTLDHLRRARGWCGTPDAVGADTRCKWPQDNVSWNIAGSLPGVPDSDFRSAIEWASQQWNAACGVRLTYKGNTRAVNVLLTVANLGGPGGVLADQELPCGARANTRLMGRYDLS